MSKFIVPVCGFLIALHMAAYALAQEPRRMLPGETSIDAPAIPIRRSQGLEDANARAVDRANALVGNEVPVSGEVRASAEPIVEIDALSGTVIISGSMSGEGPDWLNIPPARRPPPDPETPQSAEVSSAPEPLVSPKGLVVFIRTDPETFRRVLDELRARKEGGESGIDFEALEASFEAYAEAYRSASREYLEKTRPYYEAMEAALAGFLGPGETPSSGASGAAAPVDEPARRAAIDAAVESVIRSSAGGPALPESARAEVLAAHARLYGTHLRPYAEAFLRAADDHMAAFREKLRSLLSRGKTSVQEAEGVLEIYIRLP
jgi:hypothetical protein